MVKLRSSVSMSGPSATANPMSAKIVVSSSQTWLSGWMRPASAGASRSGSVTSMVSEASRASSAADFKTSRRAAKAAVEKAGQYAFRDRKRKKRTFRALWIQRLNAAVRPFGMTYSVFINGLTKSGITVDRKVLSDLAIHEPAAFQAIAEKAKAALAA